MTCINATSQHFVTDLRDSNWKSGEGGLGWGERSEQKQPDLHRWITCSYFLYFTMLML